jgi:hypothetical protein
MCCLKDSTSLSFMYGERIAQYVIRKPGGVGEFLSDGEIYPVNP